MFCFCFWEGRDMTDTEHTTSGLNEDDSKLYKQINLVHIMIILFWSRVEVFSQHSSFTGLLFKSTTNTPFIVIAALRRNVHAG